MYDLPRTERSPNGQYIKLTGELGRGAYKAVYLARDCHSLKLVAWCELLRTRQGEDDHEQFVNEAKMLRGLNHPNILQFYSFFESPVVQNKMVLITEYMSSGSLKKFIQETPEIKLSDLKSWCRQVLRGLAFLHAQNPLVIHRDIKCDNFLFDATLNTVKIGDLGLATVKTGSFVTSVVGTPGFMAPEVFSERYDEAVDVFAFGMSVLEMVTRQYPYAECLWPFEMMQKIESGIMPASVGQVENTKVRGLILMCIQTQKEYRPTSEDLLNLDFFGSELTEERLVVSVEEESSKLSLQEAQLEQKKGIQKTPSSAVRKVGRFHVTIVSEAQLKPKPQPAAPPAGVAAAVAPAAEEPAADIDQKLDTIRSQLRCMVLDSDERGQLEALNVKHLAELESLQRTLQPGNFF